MPLTPDRRHGQLDEDDGILLTPAGTVPIINGEFRYVSSVGFRFFQEGVERGLGDLTETEHKVLRQLIHLADNDGPMDGFASGLYQEITGGPVFPTSYIWYTDNSPTKKKIVEELIVYNANKTIATDTFIAYAADGLTILITMVDTWTYSSVFPISRLRTIV